MKILITGAAGFVGKNLTAALENIRDGKDRTHPGLSIETLYLYDIDSPAELLEEACAQADFVFNLAGINRPYEDTREEDEDEDETVSAAADEIEADETSDETSDEAAEEIVDEADDAEF